MQTEEPTTVATEESELEIDVEAENCYARVTQKSQTEVEEYARQVKELFLSHKWDKIAEMISYPIEINGIVYRTPSEIEHIQLEQNYSEMFMSALKQERCQKMYCDSDGICLGSGEIWIAEVERNGSKELKIVSINRLIKREEETNLLVREKYQKTEWTAARETKYIYDNQEQLWKTVRYDGEGKVTSIYESNYDEAGNLLKKATYDSGGKITQSHECNYDKKRNMIEEISYNSEGTVTKTYDNKGRLLKTVTLDSEGNSVNMEENSYDKAGNLIKKYYESKTTKKTLEYSYDEAGRIIKSGTFYNPAFGSGDNRTEYKYNKAGNLVEEISTIRGMKGKIEYFYIKD